MTRPILPVILPLRSDMDAEITRLCQHPDPDAQRIGMELAKLAYSCVGSTGDWIGDYEAVRNIMTAVTRLASKVSARASTQR